MGNQIPLFFSFNTQPPEGGWLLLAGSLELGEVSTHSRPKAAGSKAYPVRPRSKVSTHSRPKAAGIVFNIETKS